MEETSICLSENPQQITLGNAAGGKIKGECSGTVRHEFLSTGVAILNKKEEDEQIPSCFVPAREEDCEDMKELKRSAIVNVERTIDTYFCVHNATHAIAQSMELDEDDLNWKPYNDNKFLITFENNQIRDGFTKKHSTIYLTEALFRSKNFEVNETNNRHPTMLKVWLTIRGLPVQHLCWRTALIIASRFGKLYACNGAKKATFVGAFNIMVDCRDLNQISPSINIYFEDEGMTKVEISKDYVCSIEAFNSFKFDETILTYEDVIYGLLESNKLTQLH